MKSSTQPRSQDGAFVFLGSMQRGCKPIFRIHRGGDDYGSAAGLAVTVGGQPSASSTRAFTLGRRARAGAGQRPGRQRRPSATSARPSRRARIAQAGRTSCGMQGSGTLGGSAGGLAKIGVTMLSAGGQVSVCGGQASVATCSRVSIGRAPSRCSLLQSPPLFASTVHNKSPQRRPARARMPQERARMPASGRTAR